MKRKMIKIDGDRCNGCGLCARACHEGAIGMVKGKATLLRDDYCDGLGDCLPVCPTGAISFEQREAAAYDEAAVRERMRERAQEQEAATLPCGCSGTHSRAIEGQKGPRCEKETRENESRLSQWPVQIRLAPENAPWLQEARLLLAADCTAYAYAGFHKKFMEGRVTLIGCPKLDATDYAEKLTAVLEKNNIKSITLVRMEVPCCAGLEQALKAALQRSGVCISWQVITISTDGKIIEEV